MTTKIKVKTKVRYSDVLDTSKYVSEIVNLDKLKSNESINDKYNRVIDDHLQFVLDTEQLYQISVSGKWWNNGVTSDTETIDISLDDLDMAVADWLDDQYKTLAKWFHSELQDKFDAKKHVIQPDKDQGSLDDTIRE